MSFAAASIAVVLPTFNPDERIFGRVIRSLASLENRSLQIEYVIVDNNSEQAVEELAFVRDFLTHTPSARVVREPRQGLTFSRLAGIRATEAPILVFFDDDNEPAPDYLKVASECSARWPLVGIWGPGQIRVEFVDPVPDWFACDYARYFSAKECSELEYGSVKGGWQTYYPIGMGQVMRRDVAEHYATAVETGVLGVTDRQGGSLASAGDVQLVWEAVKLDYAAGTNPSLALTHLIPAKRSNMAYVRKLTFGCSVSYLPALAQSFPAQADNPSKRAPSNWYIWKGMLRLTIINLLRFRPRTLPLDLAHFFGEIVSRLRLAESTERRWVLGLVRLMKME